MDVRGVDRAVGGSVHAGRCVAWGAAALVAVLGAAVQSARAAEPLVVISVTSGGGTNVCDTNCTDCGPGSPECVFAAQYDLLLCKPLSTGLPITSCDWSKYVDGTILDDQPDDQIRAVDVAPNGNLTMVVVGDDDVPGFSDLRRQDIAVFNPADVLKPFVGGGPYTSGVFDLYLNGNLTAEIDLNARPWDAMTIMPSGDCEKNISAVSAADRSCPIIGSLTSSVTSGPGLEGLHFENEDLVRCIPDAFSGGTVEGCTFAMFLEADRINGVGNGINGDIEAIEFLSFDSATMEGEMVFKMAGSNPPGFPVHDNGKDLLLYDGTFGAGNCVPSGKPCAGIEDCLVTDSSCDTGTCAIGGAPCASDDDCNLLGGVCNVARTPISNSVTTFFDGNSVGLTGTGQNIEAFAVIPEGDGDGIPDGVDNCPTDPNPPTVCSGPGSETCPSGLSSQCPMGESCVQSDADGDGIGDPCDQCNGRPDEGTCDACPGAPCPLLCLNDPGNDCSCGDGIFDSPGEQCDLGGQNGQPGSPCSPTCTISGTCTRSMAACTLGSDCAQFAAGEGCCGNNVRDDVDGPGGVVPDEDCDDGNTVQDDLCDSACQAVPGGTPLLGCEDLTGPNIVPASVKATKFKDTDADMDADRWKAKGEGIFITGLTIDPDTEDVRIIFNNTPDGELFSSTLAPANCGISCFVQKDPKLKWKFKDKEADVPGSPSWRKGKFAIKNNKTKFVLDGRNVPLFPLSAGATPMRQTVRVGDVCITAVIGCQAKGSSLKCASLP